MAPGAKTKDYEHAGRRLRLLESTKEFTETDWCEKGHIGYILEGEVEIDFDGELVRFKTGDGLFIPEGKGSKHMAKVLSDTLKVILVEEVGH